ncbi:MAG: homoserine kinase [Mobiluncus sp.]|uniref:homoserine kinase n=1 Tax=Mobiluncus sp. TaxID=47293 RepID=UPI0025890B80|nr:homoserine kinase [Mobiluncus sp.]MCI6583735.1 homoserine kinase [Mobiluncus sp.]
MNFVRDEVTVSVPASSANLGPGFDAIGVALEMRDEVTVRATTGKTRVTVEGEGAGEVPTDDSNMVVEALRAGLDAVGASQIGIEMRCVNRVPHGRGLGSSSAAIVSGLAAASALLEPGALTRDEIFEIAAHMEGHPDNAAPAVYGGAALGWIEPADPLTGAPAQAFARSFEVSQDVRVTVLIPEFEFSTSKARAMLPDAVPHRDAAFNAGRAALLPIALSQHPSLLYYATEDRLHQEYRRAGMPPTLDLIDRLRAEKLPAAVSGAGPTVIVFAHLNAAKRQEIALEGWKPLELPVATQGIIVKE